MTKKPVGWRREQARHSLAARGIKTKKKVTKNYKRYFPPKNSFVYSMYPKSAQKQTSITPQEFLKLTLSEDDRLSSKGVEKYEGKIKRGEELDPPYMKVDIDTGQVIEHEGRHRSQAAINQGLRRVPVVIIHMKNMERWEHGKKWMDISEARAFLPYSHGMTEEDLRIKYTKLKPQHYDRSKDRIRIA